MKIFGRTGGHYLLWSGIIYLTVGIICAIFFKEIPSELIQLTWITVLALPFLVPPIGRHFDMDIKWDKNMIDWFKRYTDNKPTNVVEFPTLKAVPQVPPVKEPVTTDSGMEEEAIYTVGVNEHGYTKLKIKNDYGHTTLTMSEVGVIELIETLAHAIRKTHKTTIVPIDKTE